jgi:hypothetical protein
MYRDLVYVAFSVCGALVNGESMGVNVVSVRLPSLGATLSKYVISHRIWMVHGHQSSQLSAQGYVSSRKISLGCVVLRLCEIFGIAL